MSTLSRERCVACRPDSPRVSDLEIPEFMEWVPEWKILERDGIKQLERTFRIIGMLPPMRLADMIAEKADVQDHHPRLTIEWGSLTVTWWTRAIKGLHRNDFIMAATCDELFESVMVRKTQKPT